METKALESIETYVARTRPLPTDTTHEYVANS